MIIIRISDGIVRVAATAPTLPDGWLEVIPAIASMERPPPLQVPDGNGGFSTVPQPSVPVPSVAGPNQIRTYMAPDVAAIGMAMVDEAGLLVPRPVSPAPVINGNIVTIPPCPAGTVIKIDDGLEYNLDVVAEVEGWTEQYELADAGTYKIEIAAPHPAVETVRTVT